MNYMARKKRRENKSKLVIGIIVALGLIISIYLLSILKIPFFSQLSNKAVYTIDATFSSIAGVFKEGFSYFGNTKKLNEKVEKLEEELEKEKIAKVEQNVLLAENNDLKQMLEIKEKYNHFEKVYANIVVRSYDNWNETFIINKGEKDGIKEKQTVVAKEGLVGYISYVGENTSTVTTILDPSSAVSVQVSNINKLALAKGDYSLKSNGKLKLVNIPIDTELSSGETVYSSGIGMLYKKGIPVGKITEVIHKKNDIDRYAIVDVLVDISSLELVAVITN